MISRCFLSSTQPKLERSITKNSINLPLNAFVIKNDLIFLCVCFGLEAIIVAVFLRRAIDIHQNILGVTTLER